MIEIASLTASDIIDMTHRVPLHSRYKAVFRVNRATRRELARLKDKQGRWLLFVHEEQETLVGYPLVQDSECDGLEFGVFDG